MLLYADEDFSYPVVEELRRFGHDVLTAQDDGRKGASDSEILGRAHRLGRSVLTNNRRHFERLHRRGSPRSGIRSAQHHSTFSQLAARIHATFARLLQG